MSSLRLTLLRNTAATSAFVLALLLPRTEAALDQTQANALATYLYGQVGRTHGFASAPRCGNGTLALALLTQSAMTVHAMDSDTANVGAARQLALSSGQAGMRFCVEKGLATALPYADNYVDLLVITGLADADLAGVSFAEVQRVLCPGGKAYVGRAAVEGAGLNLSALQSWVSGKSNASAGSDAQGMWAVVGKTEVAGTDVWTHRYHGPDNNPASLDTVANWPGLLQYRVKPYRNARYGSVVTSNGRMFIVFNEPNYGSYRSLRAFRVYNGQMLWKRNCQQDWASSVDVYPASYSCIVAQGDNLFMMKKGAVLRLDGESGTRLDSIALGTGTSQVKWIAIDNNILYALVGDPALDTNGAFYGATVCAWNLASSSMAWTQSEAGGRIDNRHIAISNGKLFYYVRNTAVVCRNSATGAQVWATSAANVITPLTTGTAGQTFCTGGQSGMTCSPYGVYICTAENPNYVAVSATDGSLLWTTTYANDRAEHKVILNNVLFSKSVADHGMIDITTNQPVTTYNNLNWGAGCGPISGTSRLFFGNAGQLADYLSPYRSMPYRSYKIDCSVPVEFSNGLILYPNAACGCPDLHRGIIAETRAGGFSYDQPAVEAQRLEKGPAWGAISGTVTVGANDWFTYRANNKHSGFVGATLPSSPHLMWTYYPQARYDTAQAPSGASDGPDMVPTPAIVVGNRVFWGGTDGYVRCVSAGAEVWKFATGGRILMAPACADGCVYAGSADGYAYCIDAADGRLVWRFRAAPIERRVFLYNLLSSNWPVASGVLVSNGRAYFAAGLDEEYGTHVYCVDSRTGALLWQNNTTGVCYNSDARIGVTPSGCMAIVGSKLWLKAHHDRDAIFDLATGTMDSLSAIQKTQGSRGVTRRGTDICVIDSLHVVRGGRLLYADKSETGQYVRSSTYDLARISAQGVPLYPSLQVSDWASNISPAWEGQNFYYVLQGEWTLECWNTARLTAVIDSVQAANDVASNPGNWPNWKEWTITPSWCSSWQTNPAATPMSTWRQADTTTRTVIRGMALGANALAVIQDKGSPKLTYLNRTSGAVLFQTNLPAAPLWGGIAIGSDGTVYVTYPSGEVAAYGSGAVSIAGATEMLQPASPPATSVPVSAQAFAPGSVENPVAAPVAVLPVRTYAGRLPPVTGTAEQPAQAYFPLLDSIVTTSSGTVATLGSIPTSERAAAVYRPADMRWRPEQACLSVAGVKASSSAGVNGPGRTLDRNLATRWTPSAGGTQSITYDLGLVREIAAASLVWYSARQTTVSVRVETSLDGVAFAVADQGTLEGRGTHSALRSFVAQQARYVRISLTPAQGSACPSLYEVGLHAEAAQREALAR
jgi:outer membrane protein assembly factor BamB